MRTKRVRKYLQKKKTKKQRGKGSDSCNPKSTENQILDWNQLNKKYDKCCSGLSYIWRPFQCRSWSKRLKNAHCDPSLFSEKDKVFFLTNEEKALAAKNKCCKQTDPNAQTDSNAQKDPNAQKDQINECTQKWDAFLDEIQEEKKRNETCKDFTDEYIYSLTKNVKEATNKYKQCCPNGEIDENKEEENDPYQNGKKIVNPCKLLKSTIKTAKIQEKENFVNLETKKGLFLQQQQEANGQSQSQLSPALNFSIRSPGVRIGEESLNGNVLQIPFEKNNFEFFAVLKISKGTQVIGYIDDEPEYLYSDNPIYEYFVGSRIINHFAKKYPCFLETYGLYKINDDIFKKLQNNKIVHFNKNSFHEVRVKNDDELWNLSCTNPNQFSVLTQFFPNFQTIASIYDNLNLERNNSPYFFEFPGILYQIYFGIDQTKYEFTHDDLHPNNAGFYEPFYAQYITLHYHLEDDSELIFSTSKISKIIDYGRVVFSTALKSVNDTKSTEKVQFDICGDYNHQSKYKSCRKKDCSMLGFKNLNTYKLKDLNKKTDLRLLLDIDAEKLVTSLYDIFSEIILNKPDRFKYNKNERIIYNVQNARESLEIFMREKWLENLSEKHFQNLGYTKAGDMHIYTDGKDFKFIPV